MGEAEVKVEEFDGTYACVICSESVRGGDALHCALCSSNPVHLSCVRGSPFAETCPQCSGQTMQVLPWKGIVGSASSSAEIALVSNEDSCSAGGGMSGSAGGAASGKGKEIVDDEEIQPGQREEEMKKARKKRKDAMERPHVAVLWQTRSHLCPLEFPSQGAGTRKDLVLPNGDGDRPSPTDLPSPAKMPKASAETTSSAAGVGAAPGASRLRARKRVGEGEIVGGGGGGGKGECPTDEEHRNRGQRRHEMLSDVAEIIPRSWWP